jgi:hypothetical protein
MKPTLLYEHHGQRSAVVVFDTGDESSARWIR